MLRRYAVIEVGRRLRSAGPVAQGAVPSTGKVRVHEADLSARDVRDLARDATVEDFGLVMPVSLVTPVARGAVGAGPTPETPWGVAAVGADRVDLDGSGVVVAVLDTGIDRLHPAFAGVDVEEEDFGGSGNGDRNGHGTHCAGTFFGRDVGGLRIGVARNVGKALVAKVLRDDGTGDSLAVFRAMEWAAGRRANVVSMSLGFDFPGMAGGLERDGYPIELATSIALEHFTDSLRMFDSMMRVIEAGRPFGRGPIVVAAAGNESRRDQDPRFRLSASLPAAAMGVISVAALRRGVGGLEVADFSNGRAKVCAPGEDVVSAAPGGGLATMSGTSMACPHVAGLAALWWQKVASSPIRPNADTVSQRLLAATTTDRVARFDPADAEAGLAVAPS